MLSSTQTLPQRPQRILVAGVSGVGKSTLSRRIADATGSPYTEIDALYHGPDWTPRPAFEADVDAFTQAAAWVIEWQYTPVRAMLAARADTMVLLDLPAAVAIGRVVRRTIRRSRSREVLWNGNVEPGMWHALTNRDGIIRWAVTTRHTWRARLRTVETDYPHLQFVLLRSQREIKEWLSGPFAASL